MHLWCCVYIWMSCWISIFYWGCVLAPMNFVILGAPITWAWPGPATQRHLYPSLETPSHYTHTLYTIYSLYSLYSLYNIWSSHICLLQQICFIWNFFQNHQANKTGSDWKTISSFPYQKENSLYSLYSRTILIVPLSQTRFSLHIKWGTILGATHFLPI